MSIGHIARALEQSGISTIVISSGVFKDRVKAMCLPRTVFTNHIMGRPLGMPKDRLEQRRIIDIGLDLLVSAENGNSIVDLIEN